MLRSHYEGPVARCLPGGRNLSGVVVGRGFWPAVRVPGDESREEVQMILVVIQARYVLEPATASLHEGLAILNCYFLERLEAVC